MAWLLHKRPCQRQHINIQHKGNTSKLKIAVRRHRMAMSGAPKIGTIILSTTYDNGELGPDTACLQFSLEVLAADIFNTLKSLLYLYPALLAISIRRTRLPAKRTVRRTPLEKVSGQLPSCTANYRPERERSSKQRSRDSMPLLHGIE